jgi:hypothetical protein
MASQDPRRRGQNYGSSATFGPVSDADAGTHAPGELVRLLDVSLCDDDDPLGSWVVAVQGDTVEQAAAPVGPLQTTGVLSWGTGAWSQRLEFDWLRGATFSVPGTTCTLDVRLDAGQAAATIPLNIRCGATCQRSIGAGFVCRATRWIAFPPLVALSVFDAVIPPFARAWNATGSSTTNVGIFDITTFWDLHAGAPVVAANRVVRFNGANARAQFKDTHTGSLGGWLPGNVDRFRITMGAAAAASGVGDGIMLHIHSG